MKDAQRKRAYMAETALRTYLQEELLSLAEAESFAKIVWPPIKQVLFTKKRLCTWWRSTETIELAPWGRTELTILHEVAHAIREASSIHEEVHGRVWAAVFCVLVYFYISPEAHHLLCLAYNAAGVQHLVMKAEWANVAFAMRRVLENESMPIAANKQL